MTTYDTIISNIQASMSLTSKSVTAFYAKLAEAVAQVVDVVLSEITNTVTIITNIVSQQGYGKPLYYINHAKAYQVGDDLLTDQYGNYYYGTINSAKQIITQAAFTEVIIGLTASLVIKVATTDTGTGLLIPLTSGQLADFKSYMSNFEIPGLPLTIVSDTGNSLAFNAAITYEKTYNLATIQANVATALLKFQSTFTFNGIFYNYALESYLVQNVPGVTDVYLSGTTIDSVSFAGQTPLTAGYFNYGTTTIVYGAI